MEIVAALAKSLLLPPFGLFLLMAAGWLMMPRRLGRVLFAAGLAALYLFSTPYIGSSLLRGLQVDQALPPDRSVPDVGAIVVLGADVRRHAPEFGGDTVGALTLERIRYGAKLHRELGLPLLVTGGATRSQGQPIGLIMRDSLEQDFLVQVRWAETEAVNTYENAKHSSDI